MVRTFYLFQTVVRSCIVKLAMNLSLLCYKW